MKRLEHLFKLGSKVTVYVPSTVEVDKQIDNEKYVKAVAEKLSVWFGGATSTPARGYWVSTSAGLVKEDTTIVFAYTDTENLQNCIDRLVDLCEWLKVEMTQESVALEINGEMYFI